MKDWDKESLRQGVCDIVKYIPRGRATSYGAVAKAAGYPNLSRMVGKIMAGCSEIKMK
jgi:methylated-DNA-protein-cysteine methyltransferase-like protein